MWVWGSYSSTEGGRQGVLRMYDPADNKCVDVYRRHAVRILILNNTLFIIDLGGHFFYFFLFGHLEPFVDMWYAVRHNHQAVRHSH